MANQSNTSAQSGGISFLSLLALLFIGLKLTGVIDWSWWWVTAPLWGGLAALAVVLLLVGTVVLVFRGIAALLRWKRNREQAA
jgi:membrane protein YdbS with pleckstrin-like domain